MKRRVIRLIVSIVLIFSLAVSTASAQRIYDDGYDGERYQGVMGWCSVEIDFDVTQRWALTYKVDLEGKVVFETTKKPFKKCVGNVSIEASGVGISFSNTGVTSSSSNKSVAYSYTFDNKRNEKSMKWKIGARVEGAVVYKVKVYASGTFTPPAYTGSISDYYSHNTDSPTTVVTAYATDWVIIW